MIRIDQRPRPASRPGWVVALLLTASQAASAGQIVATLSADPSTIDQGESTLLTLTLDHTPRTGFKSETQTNPLTKIVRSYTGSGSITSFLGTLTPGDGRPGTAVNGSPSGNTAQFSTAVQYMTPGTYTASFSGSATTSEEVQSDTYKRPNASPHAVWSKQGSEKSNEILTAVISATTQITVSNLNPSITLMSWVPQVLVGESFDFSVTASDPGGDPLTFAFDLDGDGQYDDFVESGVTTSTKAHSFVTAGLYELGVRVTDGFGGVALGSVSVTVTEPVIEAPTNAVPEPSTLAMAASACLALLAYRRRRRILATA